jgi:tRNA G46 methylase TrmB
MSSQEAKHPLGNGTASLGTEFDPEEKVYYPASERNAPFIIEQIKKCLPDDATNVLEIASGGGQHVVKMAKTWPHVSFQPSEMYDRELRTIKARVQEAKITNVCDPLIIDAAKDFETWPVKAYVIFESLRCLCMNGVYGV